MSRRHRHPVPPRPAVAALLTMAAGVGAVGRFLGSEAGLLALVLAVVALVVLPSLYLGHDEHLGEDHQADDAADGTEMSARHEPGRVVDRESARDGDRDPGQGSDPES